MGEAEYKWVGTHAQELTGGRMLEPGEKVLLSDEVLHDEHNQSLLADGGLIAVDEKGERQVQNAARRIKTRAENEAENRPVTVGDVVPEPERAEPKTGREET